MSWWSYNTIRERLGLIHRTVFPGLLRGGILSLLIFGPGVLNAADRESRSSGAGVSFSSSLVQRYLSTERTQTQPVTKFLLGANITGQQTTVTHVRAVLVPCENQIQIDFINSGNVQSTTSGITPDAMVENVGQHQFEITKSAWFDGTSIRTTPAYGIIRASQSPVRVRSSMTAMPLIGPIADRIAWSEVMRRSPEIADAVARDLASDILPQIDVATDSELSHANRKLQSWQQPLFRLLADTNLSLAVRSTSSAAHLWINSSSEAVDSVSSQQLPQFPRPCSEGGYREDIVITISESFANSLLAKAVRPGKVISDRTLGHMERVIAGLSSHSATGTDADNSDAATSLEAEVFSIQMADQNPIQLAFRGGEIDISATIRILTTPGPTSGWHTVHTRLKGTGTAEGEWYLAMQDVSAAEQESAGDSDPPDESPDRLPSESQLRTTGTAWSMLIETAIRSAAEKLSRMPIPRTLRFSETDVRIPSLRLLRIRSSGGQLLITFSAEQAVTEVSSTGN